MAVIVTGATSFIGRAVVEELFKTGTEGVCCGTARFSGPVLFKGAAS